MIRPCRFALAALCSILALPAAPLAVTIRVHRIGPHSVVAEQSFEIAAGDGASLLRNPDGGESLYCEFEVAGSSKAIRAVALKQVLGADVAVLAAH
jgi:hypothetical protein